MEAMDDDSEYDPPRYSDAEIKVFASVRDGKKSFQLDLESPIATCWADIQARLISELHVDPENAAFTYSIDPHFLSQPDFNSFHCLGLRFEVDWKAAAVTAVSIPGRSLYILVEELSPVTDILKSMRQLSTVEEIDGARAARGMRPRRRSTTSTWDFLDVDAASVRHLWKRLPSLKMLPFSSLLLWQRSVKTADGGTWISTIGNHLPLQEFEWPEYLDKKRRLVKEPELRLRVFHTGVSPQLRPIVWRHLLYVFPPKLTWSERYDYIAAERTNYFKLRNAWKSRVKSQPPEVQTVLSSIRHDVIRTDRDRKLFAKSSSPYLECLYNVLATYVLSHKGAQYVQGMNEFAAVFLEVFSGESENSEADAYTCLESYLRLVTALFDPTGLALKFSHFQALLHRYDSLLFEHLQASGCGSLIFCCPWLLLNLKREFSYDDVLLLWEVMWSTLSPPDIYTNKLSESADKGGGTTPTPLEYTATEVEGIDLQASQIEDCSAAILQSIAEEKPDSLIHCVDEEDEMFAEMMPFDVSIPDRDSVQGKYGNLMVLFVSVAMVCVSREAILNVSPTEESLAHHFNQRRGLHSVSEILDRARFLMEDFVSKNDQKVFQGKHLVVP